MNVDMRADYSLSIKDVSAKFAITCWGNEKAIAFLPWAGIGWDTNKTDDLPSWVPDWQRKRIFWMSDSSMGLGGYTCSQISFAFWNVLISLRFFARSARYLFAGYRFVYGPIHGEIGGMAELNGLEVVTYNIE
jgi:hypothetical protein